MYLYLPNKFKVDLQPGSSTVQVAGEHQPYRKSYINTEIKTIGIISLFLEKSEDILRKEKEKKRLR